MRTGIVLEHYAGRNDIRELVARLACDHELVLFAARDVLETVRGPFETRPFVQSFSLAQRLWLQVFNLAGHIPRSRENFLVTEAFKLTSVTGWRRRFAMVRLRLRLALPSVLSFDALLERLKGSDRTPIDDVDRFLVITELTSPSFLAHVLAAGKPVDAYVYSWDHACKHTRVSSRVDRWFVWHDGIADDLVRLQGILPNRTFAVGSTQLAYVYEYLRRPDKRVPRRKDQYIYYGCGVGHTRMAAQEAKLIEYLADALGRILPDVGLLVRPYPHLADTEFFRGLRARPNVEFDAGYRIGRTSLALSEDDIFARLNLQEHSLAFVHCGTTMGLEGAYLGSPVLFLDLQDVDLGVTKQDFYYLGKFIHQYHNEKYMMIPGFPNVIRNAAALDEVLRRLIDERNDLRAYNRRIAASMPLRSLSDISLDMTEGVAPRSGSREHMPSTQH